MSSQSWYRIEQNAATRVADVFIYDEISWFGIMASEFVTELATVQADVINLHLNSPGGYVDDGVAIFNALKNHPATVNVFIEGIAASIASVIAMAGERVVIAPHARMMIHNARMVADGDDEDFLAHAARLADSNRNIASIYVERAGGDIDEWLTRMKATTWYTDQQAVDAGLADEVGRSNDKKAAALAARQIAQFPLLSKFPEGDRMVARLVTELAHDAVVDPEQQHVCACGGADDCPLTAHAPEPPAPSTNKHIAEREALEAAIASVY